jgi:hypothetical protein
VLTFASAPNFEAPGDAGADNVYDVQVTVTDPGLLTDVQNLQVTVLNVPEVPIVGDESFDDIGNTLLQVAASDTATGPHVFVTGNVLSNDTNPEAPPMTAALFGAPSGGATVNLNSDGTFTYLPGAGSTGAQTFQYKASNGSGASAAATVTINLQQMVWYVKNDQAAGGLGRSSDPFDTLAEAQTASAANHWIFVFFGDGTTLGQDAGILLKAGQHLIGEFAGLSIPVSVNGGPTPTVLLAAPGATACGGNPCRPFLDDTTAGTPDGVAATDVIPAEIIGLNLAGNVNAIDWTTTGAFAGTGTLAILDNVVRSAGVEGVDINLAGTAATTLAFSLNNLTSTGTALDIQETGAGAGALTIMSFQSNAVSGNSAGSGIVISSAKFDADPATAAYEQVTGGTTVIGASGNPVGAAGMVLSTITGDLGFTDLDIFAGGGVAFSLNGNGAVNTGAGTGTRLTVGAGVGIFQATGGPAVSVNNATVDLQLSSLQSTNSPTTGVSLVNADDGTTNAVFSAGSGSSITGSSGTGFVVDSSNADVDYAGTLNVTTGAGVSLTNNTNGTIDFTGTLTLSTGAQSSFVATGGGTVTSTNTASTLASTTGTSLNIANTTIGALGLTFRSINTTTASGSVGIVLNTTGSSGGLTVTGTGAANSGGTISNKTGDAISLVSTQGVSLTDMVISTIGGSWIDATTVNGLTLVRMNADLSTDHGILASSLTNLVIQGGTFDRGGAGNGAANFNGINITNLLGTSSVTGATFKRSNTIQFRVNNNTATNFAGTPDTLTVSNNQWNTHSGTGPGEVPFAGDHLSVNSDTGANFRLIVNNTGGANVFKTGGIAVQATAGGTTGKMDAQVSFITSGGNTGGVANSDTNTAGVVIGETGGGGITFDIHNNTMLGTGSVGIKVTHASGGGTSTGKISDNTITHVAGPGTDAIGVDLQGVGAVGGTGTYLIKNNTITGNYQRGIKAQVGQGNPVMNATIDSNTLTGTDTTATALQQIDVEAGLSGAGSVSTMRLNMLNNVVLLGPAATYTAAYRLINRAGNTFQLQNFTPGVSPGDVQNWVTTVKTNSGTPVAVTATAAFTASAGNIPTPP